MSQDSNRASSPLWDAPDPGDLNLLPNVLLIEPIRLEEPEKPVDLVPVEIADKLSSASIDVKPLDQTEDLSGHYCLAPPEPVEVSDPIEPEAEVVKTEPELKSSTFPAVMPIEPDVKEKIEIFKKKLEIRVVEIRRHRQRRRRRKFLVALIVVGILLALLLLSFSRVAY